MIEGHSQAGSRPAAHSPSRGHLSENTAPMLSATASNNHSLFSFGRSNGTDNMATTAGNGNGPLSGNRKDSTDDSTDRSAGFDFLPSVSFDDLQSSLESASTEFKLAQFPSPSGQGSILGVRSAAAPVTGRADRPPNGMGPPTLAAIGGSSGSTPTTTSSRISIPSSISTSTVASRGSKTGILRRPSITNRQNNTPASSTSIPDLSAPAASRQRRQSHYPPVSNSGINSISNISNITKPPRKSVGPGLFDPEYGSVVGRSTSRRRPSVASNTDRPISNSTRSSLDGGSRPSTSDITKGLTGSRAAKAKSIHTGVQNGAQNGVHGTPKVLTVGPDQFRSSGSSTRTARASLGTPSNSSVISFGLGSASKGSAQSSAKRMSIAPPSLHSSHATGLGARTISPTDTRRMNRMSIMPPSNGSTTIGSAIGNGNGSSSTATNNTSNANAIGTNANSTNSSRDATQVSGISLPPSDVRASSRSPSLLPRKTSTPSSLRTTPDPNRKSYSSGISGVSGISGLSALSAGSSSVRTSIGMMQPRLSQGSMPTATNGSRLPAPKALATGSAISNGDDDEDVPPVPAIPKAYESPKGSPAELSFLEKRKSNLGLDSSSIHSNSTASISGVPLPPPTLEPPAKIKRQASTRARDVARLTQVANGQSASSVGVGKKNNLQPLRLPPINLMPLSTPTTAKIAALQDKGARNHNNMSPPPSRIIAKTPTTPMTASKGSFFSRHHIDDDLSDFPSAMRSSSSVHHHTRHITPSGDDTGSSSESVAAMSKASFQKPSMSPFLSSSVPQGGSIIEASPYGRRTINGDGDDFTSGSFTTPAPPPIPASTPLLYKPSGPRAPAPTPSRAFAAMDTPSTIFTAADAAASGSPRRPRTSSIMAPPAKSPPPLSSPEEPPTPSSIGSSLRRKLSLSWKRNKGQSDSQGSSLGDPTKPTQTPAQPQQHPHQHHIPFHHTRQSSSGVKHDGMPPPRIPISSTLNSLKVSPTASTSSTVTRAADLYRDPTRRKTSASSMSAAMAQDKTRMADIWGPTERTLQKKDSMTSNLTTVSNFTTLTTASTTTDLATSSQVGSGARSHVTQNSSVMQKILKPKPSASSLRQKQQQHSHRQRRPEDAWSTAELDKDDMIAEEEMRKLGSRRKETELAARTLDALRKRATPKERVSPHEAIRVAMLNIYERGEIVDYNDVYFCGTQNAAKVVGDLHTNTPNFGYDDERGDYAIVPGDHLAYRYEIIDTLGKGSFGQVVRCIDHKTGVLVAVKIIRNKKRFHQQALVEVNILQKLREWDPNNKHSMVNFTHSFYFRGHLCISTELLDMNLYEFTKANGFRGFSLKMIRRFTKQLLSSLLLLKQHRVIHCDLKPENILLRHPLHTEIKMIDFGSSCFENEKVYTYIQSRFYRSPEVILGMTYGMPIDMWSLGCILAELYTGVPIFPGENEQEQLACIMEVFGPPEKHLIEKSTRKKLFFDSMGKPRLTVSSKGRRRRPSSKTLQQAIKCDDEPFLDFLGRCLRWDPDRRLKPEEAVRHEFMTGHKTVAAPVLAGRSSSAAFASTSGRDSSPIRRHNTIVAAGPRPLPDLPLSSSGSSKLSAPTLRAVGGNASSPHKSSSMGPTVSSSRRASAVTALGAGPMTKRTSGGIAGFNGRASAGGAGAIGGSLTTSTSMASMTSLVSMTSMASSNLPRAAGRVPSGTKSDLAAAGATAAMTRRA